MSPSRARGAVHVRSLRPLAALPLLLLTALVVLPSASAAPSLADKRAEARAVEAEVMDLEARLEVRVEAYNAAQQSLSDTRARLRRTEQLLGIARGNLTAAERRLATSIARAYKSGDSDVLSYLLAAGSFTELIDQMQALDTAREFNGELVDTVTRYRADVARRERQLEADRRRLSDLVAERAAAKQAVEQGLAERRQTLAGIESDIRQIIEERRRAAERAAARAAAQAAAAAAAQASTAEAAAPSGAAPSTATVAVPPSSGVGAQAAAIAQQYLGVPYVYGGASPSGFDCSGLIMYAYAQVGVSLPHNAAAQYGMGPHVPREALQAGDLVFFAGLGHAGIYLGGGSFIHAPHTGDVVKISSLNESWYASEYVGATRVG